MVRGAYLVICTAALIYLADISKTYHNIRGQVMLPPLAVPQIQHRQTVKGCHA